MANIHPEVAGRPASLSVYEVASDGSTGAWLGAGLLIHPEMVVVRPPLSTQLKAVRLSTIRLRVAVAHQNDGELVVEVADVTDIEIVPVLSASGADSPVVLDLARPVSAPVVELDGLPSPATPTQAAEALRLYIEKLPEVRSPLPRTGFPLSLPCWLTGRHCGSVSV